MGARETWQRMAQAAHTPRSHEPPGNEVDALAALVREVRAIKVWLYGVTVVGGLFLLTLTPTR